MTDVKLRSSQSMTNLPKFKRNTSTSSDMISMALQGPSTNTAGMHLVKSFEERFCKSRDYIRDFMTGLSVELASNLSQNVVSLASFKEKTRWFASSGILIEYDLHMTSNGKYHHAVQEVVLIVVQIFVNLPNFHNEDVHKQAGMH